MRELSSRFTFLAILFAASILAGFCILVYRLSDFIPIWDGGWFLGCAIDAGRNLLDISKFSCGVHEPAVFYMALLALTQYASAESLLALHLFNACLLLLSLLACYRLLLRMFPNPELKPELLMLTAVIGTLPIQMAILFNTSLDFSVTVFLIFYTLALVRGSVIWATLAAFALAFSKETGLLVYAFSLPFVAVSALQRPLWSSINVRTALRYTPLLLPGMLHFGYFLLRPSGYSLKGDTATQLCWTDAKVWYELFLKLNFESETVQNYLFNVFALNFNWILSAIIVAALVLYAARVVRSKFALRSITIPRAWMLVIAIFVATIYVSTRCPFYNNPKYIAPALPLLVILAYAALQSIVRNRAARMSVLAVIACLNIISLFRTADPVSRYFYGTIPFGEHQLLHMTSRTGECCGYGQDQLVYNLEYTNLHYLVGQAFQDLRPGEFDPLVVPTRAWMLLYFNSKTFERKLQPDNPVSFREMSADEALADPAVSSLHYIDYPFFDTKDDLTKLRTCFREDWRREYQRDGYVLPVIRFTRLVTCPAPAQQAP